jgi:hypothetical protein
MSQVTSTAESLAQAAAPPAPPGRRIDREPAAWAVSLLVHFAGMLALATLTLAIPQAKKLVELAVQTVEDIEVDAAPREFASSERAYDQIGALSAGGGDGAALGLSDELRPESLVATDFETMSDLGQQSAVDVELELFEQGAPELSTSLPVQGAGSMGVTGAEGAIDRLTHEIVASLEQRPTLVVWLFDESGSLKDERKRIVERFRRIYDELGVIEAAKHASFAKHRDKPLLTAVVGFGAEPRMLTPQPTDAIEEIVTAIRDIDADAAARIRRNEDGKFDKEEYRYYSQENVFTAVGMAATKFHAYQSRKNGQRRVMIIVFTDEAGDDGARVDETVDVCRKFAMPVYIVGRPAPFGRETAYVKWVDPDPKYDQRPQWTPVTLGPESLAPEALKLRFIDGSDGELLDSGFGPYALTRLCYETGGLYFSTHPNRAVGRRVSGDETDNLSAHFAAFFDSDAMRPYQPDYVSGVEYVRRVQASRTRRALVEAAQLTWTSQLEGMQLRFPKRDDAELAQLLTTAQQTAAVLQPKLDFLWNTLLAGEPDRAEESEPRWQAGYDLAAGRALAAKVRADGYNMMLAKAKQGMEFKQERNNTWVLRPGEEFAATSLEQLAARATAYLERVRDEHPGTPWEMVARRELETPLGWRWDEDFTRLPPLDDGGGEGRPRRERPEPQGSPRRDPPPL